MARLRRTLLPALAGLLALRAPVTAQERAGAPPSSATAAAPEGREGRRQAGGLEGWVGYANASPQLGLLGDAPGMRFTQAALRWSTALTPASAGGLPTLEWTIDLVPWARMSPPLVSLRGTGFVCKTAQLCVETPDRTGLPERVFPRGSPYGFGITPFGVVRRFRTGRALSPFIGMNGGALYFERRVPSTKASRFNFTATGEAGLRIGAPHEQGITVSYRFHHISNAGTAGENPGLASHLITVGVHQPRWRRDASPARP